MQVENKVDIFALNETFWHGLTITDAAANHILQLIKNDSTMLGLRLSIKQSGCAGFNYLLEKATNINHNDYVYEKNGAKLYVPSQAMPFLDGTEIDYQQEGLNHLFKFHNPKARHSCGCGESFGL
ncbi:Iron-sulfur cluster assembly accessory protein [secondary endosymbiont of Heteropsylla cubana]|uniref:Iron-sulfur cluster assembly accessory protein n=1 Tax=secondary endosymbiont of Heteropsylla cubana TaxID=134287 RepID=J3Z5C4_9ENTR|nr:Fe-S cluster assembly scaffold SufA [secondary endosymbiont of Heteropsylla cubana]AFP85524.1 Iron-sulfur cluster assembly accessory protein [secondary endosymbiont of Heteropsylla cubana]